MGTQQLDWEKGILPAGYSTAVSGDGTPSILVRWRMPSPDGGVDHGEAVAALRRCGVEAGLRMVGSISNSQKYSDRLRGLDHLQQRLYLM
jgi:hypothetical protein